MGETYQKEECAQPMEDEVISKENDFEGIEYLIDILNKSVVPEKPLYIKAVVTEVIPKSFTFSGKYSLKLRIDDGTASIIVNVAEPEIEKLIGITCAEFTANMKSEAGKKFNKELSKSFENKLFRFESLLLISFENSIEPGSLPLLLHTRDPVVNDVKIIIKRLKQTGIGFKR